MKKVLIISYAFHKTEVIGSVRVRGLAKYLPEFGWDPTILTVKFPGEPELGLNIVYTPYKERNKRFKQNFGLKEFDPLQEKIKIPKLINKKRVISLAYNVWQEIFYYPDSEKSWSKKALKAVKKLFNKEKFDIIISTSPPVRSHLIANAIKKKYEVPWVADLRDLWTQNHYYSHTKIRMLIEQKLERRILAMADALITTTPYLAEELKKLHNNKIYSITNGFDNDEIRTNKIKLTNKFTITYTGMLYGGKRDPIKLFQAVNQLIFNRVIDANDIEIRFYGSRDNWLKKEINSLGLENIVKMYGIVNRTTALEKQRESQILLLLLWDHPKEKNLCPGKLFDYLGSKRPILAIGGSKGFVQEILNDTNAGTYVQTIEEIKDYLVNSYQQWKRDGNVSYPVKISNINKYGHREMAKNFSEVLEYITK